MSAASSIGQRFTQLIQHLGLSKNAFAQSLGKTATVIQHLVEERNKPGYDLLCQVFETYPNVSKDWLLLGKGPLLLAAEGPVEPAAAVAPVAAAPVGWLAANAPAATSAPAGSAPAPAPVAPPAPVTAVPPVTAVLPTAPAVAPPDPAYFTAALQTQYLQHQLALAEQRNQHLLEQQALLQQLVAVLQRNVG